MSSNTLSAADLVNRTLNRIIKSKKTELPTDFYIYKALVTDIEEGKETKEIVSSLFAEMEKPSSERRTCVLLLLDHFVKSNAPFRHAVETKIQLLQKFVKSDKKKFPPPPSKTEAPFLKVYVKEMAKQMMANWVHHFDMRLDVEESDASSGESTASPPRGPSPADIEKENEEKAGNEAELIEIERRNEEQRQFVHDSFMKFHEEKFPLIMATIKRAYAAMHTFSEVCGTTDEGVSPETKITPKNRKVFEAMSKERERLAYQVGPYRTYFEKLERFNCDKASIQRLKLTHLRICNVIRMIDLRLPMNARMPEEPIVMFSNVEDDEDIENTPSPAADSTPKTGGRSQRKRLSTRDPNYAYYPVTKKMC